MCRPKVSATIKDPVQVSAPSDPPLSSFPFWRTGIKCSTYTTAETLRRTTKPGVNTSNAIDNKPLITSTTEAWIDYSSSANHLQAQIFFGMTRRSSPSPYRSLCPPNLQKARQETFVYQPSTFNNMNDAWKENSNSANYAQAQAYSANQLQTIKTAMRDGWR